MQKITLFFLTVMTVFVVSSCKKTDDATPITVVGVWKGNGLGVITDTKSVDVSTDEIKKIDIKAGEGLAAQSFEFKADGTSSIPKNSSSTVTTEVGKYVVSADGKTLTITSSTEKDSKGNFSVQTFEIVKLTSTELKLGISKLSKKNADGSFVIDSFSVDFVTYLYGAYVFATKGLDPDMELKTAKTLQTTYNLKK